MCSAPFIGLILGFAMTYAMHLYQSRQRTAQYIIVVVVFAVLSCAKAAATATALATVGETRLDPDVARKVDLLWLVFAVSAPFVFPSPPLPPDMKMDNQIAKRQAAARMHWTMPRT